MDLRVAEEAVVTSIGEQRKGKYLQGIWVMLMGLLVRMI